jgi:polysaccharide pyruvyl transferase WcaK-like protein
MVSRSSSTWSAVRRYLARIRGVPARTERIDETIVALTHQLGQLALSVSAEAALLLGEVEVIALASTENSMRLAETMEDLGRGAAALHCELARQIDDARNDVKRVVEQLAVQQQDGTAAARFEVQDLRASTSAQHDDLGSRLAALHHWTLVSIEASLVAERDRAFRSLQTELGSPVVRTDGLSVMVITWNHAGWLPEALDSALAALAALPPRLVGQVLVLDDGSSDETSSVLVPLTADPRFRVVRSPFNLGLSRARNILLSICPTRHAVVLDADNRLLAGGTRATYDAARWLQPVIAWGHVIASSGVGTDWSAFAYAPSAASLRKSHCFDSMCVIDVDAIERLGGYSTDPQLAGVADDFELLLRCLRRGELVSFVPVVLGRYRISPHRHSIQVADQRLIEARLARAYLYDEPDFERCAIVGAHADVGVLWASAGAVDRYGITPVVAATSEPVRGGPRILMIASGGVGNVGDDAITDAAIGRVRCVYPDARIELVSDRDVPILSGPPTSWAGTVIELRRSVTADATSLAMFDAAIFAGGGNLASAFGLGLLRPRVDLCLALASQGVPVMWSGQGIGPCTYDEIDLVSSAVRASVAFGCRDSGSIEAFPKDIRDRMMLTGDDALGCPTATRDETQAALRNAGVGTERYLVAHLRLADYVGSRQFEQLIRVIDDLAADRGATVLGLCVNDNEPSEAVVVIEAYRAQPRRTSWTVIEATRSPALVRSVLAGADAVICHSYHVALWALEAGRPTLLVAASDYYKAKADGLAALAGFDGPISITPDDDLSLISSRLAEVEGWLRESRLPEVTARVEQWWDDQLRTLI